MMLEKLLIIFKSIILFFFFISFSHAELLNPNSTISPKEVIKIQLNGLQQNDLEYKDSGIEPVSYTHLRAHETASDRV